MTGETSGERHHHPNPPHPTPPNVDLLCMKPIYRHGIMDRPWLQRKRTDTLTTHRNLFFFLLGFVVVFFVFFFTNPPSPKQKKKTNKIFCSQGLEDDHIGTGRRCWPKHLIIFTIVLKETKEDEFQRLPPGDHLRSFY